MRESGNKSKKMSFDQYNMKLSEKKPKPKNPPVKQNAKGLYTKINVNNNLSQSINN